MYLHSSAAPGVDAVVAEAAVHNGGIPAGFQNCANILPGAVVAKGRIGQIQIVAHVDGPGIEVGGAVLVEGGVGDRGVVPGYRARVGSGRIANKVGAINVDTVVGVDAAAKAAGLVVLETAVYHYHLLGHFHTTAFTVGRVAQNVGVG